MHHQFGSGLIIGELLSHAGFDTVGAVQEIAGRLQVPAPNVDALLGLARLFGRVRGLYPTD